jgi:hypothetical protein
MSLHDLKSRSRGAAMSGPDWLDSPPGTPFLSCAVMLCLQATYLFDYTFLYECLLVCLLSQKLNCTIYTATVLPQVVFSCTCLTFNVTHYWTLWLNCWLWGLWLGVRFSLKCGYKLPCRCCYNPQNKTMNVSFQILSNSLLTNYPIIQCHIITKSDISK